MHGGEICVHVEINNAMYSIVDVWGVDAQDKQNSTVVWKKEHPNHVLVPTEQIITAVVHTLLRPGRVRTLVPWTARHLTAIDM